MITHIEFKDCLGNKYIHPIDCMMLETLYTVEDETEDVITYKINNYEVYESEFDRVKNILIKRGNL